MWRWIKSIWTGRNFTDDQLRLAVTWHGGVITLPGTIRRNDRIRLQELLTEHVRRQAATEAAWRAEWAGRAMG